jgi:DNA-binding transcriptional LysR family regulator
LRGGKFVSQFRCAILRDRFFFFGAARQLRIGQPAISKAIAQLEGRLGVRLLLRARNGAEPDGIRAEFLRGPKRAIEEAEEADLAARGAGAE